MATRRLFECAVLTQIHASGAVELELGRPLGRRENTGRCVCTAKCQSRYIASPAFVLLVIAAIFDHCTDPARADLDLVAYSHDKGTRISRWVNPARYQRQWDWRKLHEYFLFERPEGCVSSLLRGTHETCGSELVDYPLRHFSGNFWWSTCGHIRKLVHPMDYCFEDTCRQPSGPVFLGPEMWIASQPIFALECHGKLVDHYDVLYPRSLYAGSMCESPKCFSGGLVHIVEAVFGIPGHQANVTGERRLARILQSTRK